MHSLENHYFVQYSRITLDESTSAIDKHWNSNVIHYAADLNNDEN